MKKSLIIALIAIMMVCLCGCQEKNEYKEIYEKDPSEFIEEGAETYSSLDEVNQAIGSSIVAPSVMGKSMELFSVKDDTAIYQCLLAGCELSIKASKNTLTADDTFLGKNFVVGDFNYLVTVPKDGAMGEDVFDYVCDDIKTSIESYVANQNNPGSFLVGTYMDEVSERATAEVLDNGDGTLSLTIDWADSASVSNRWNVIFTYGDTLDVSTCTYQKVSFDDTGVETVLEEYIAEDFTLFIVDDKINCNLTFNGEEIRFSFAKIA